MTNNWHITTSYKLTLKQTNFLQKESMPCPSVPRLEQLRLPQTDLSVREKTLTVWVDALFAQGLSYQGAPSQGSKFPLHVLCLVLSDVVSCHYVPCFLPCVLSDHFFSCCKIPLQLLLRCSLTGEQGWLRARHSLHWRWLIASERRTYCSCSRVNFNKFGRSPR